MGVVERWQTEPYLIPTILDFAHEPVATAAIAETGTVPTDRLHRRELDDDEIGVNGTGDLA
jgi:hypothetical protein